MSRTYFTYMVRCSDGTLYTGYTVDDVEKRVAVHNEGKGAKYTKSRRPVVLVWYDKGTDAHEARKEEWRIKHLSKKEKEALVRGFGKERRCTTLSEEHNT